MSFISKGGSTARYERYEVALVPAFTPRPTDTELEESVAFRDLRWWTLEELEATTEELAPATLPELVRRLVEYGPPENPFAVDV